MQNCGSLRHPIAWLEALITSLGGTMDRRNNRRVLVGGVLMVITILVLGLTEFGVHY